jgi:hypothetical protein
VSDRVFHGIKELPTMPNEPSPYQTGPYEVWGMQRPPVRQDYRFHPEGMGAHMPYGFSIGEEPVVLFYGDEYAVAPNGALVPIGCEVAFGYGNNIYAVAFGFNLGHAIGHFCSNAVKTAGREVGHVTSSIQSAEGMIGRQIGKVPVVGGPLHAIFDASYHATFGMVNATVAIAQGKRVDRALMDHLRDTLHDFKQVGPYVQSVISMVPGVGQGISAAMAAGLALANGQPIGEVLKAGAMGAIPGGPLVQAAVKTGVETMQHVVKGEKLSLTTLAKSASGMAAGALGLPPAASNAITAGISTASHIAHGQPLDKALTDGVVAGLPVPDTAKKAMHEATALTLDLAHGKRIDRALESRMNGVVGMLPVSSPLRNSITNGLDTVRKIGGGGDPQKVMFAALQSGVGDELLSMGASQLPPSARNGLKSGIALGTGLINQTHQEHQLTKVIPGKLVESGLQLAKSAPLFTEARKIAASKGGSHGFDMASGLLQQQAGVYHVATVRNMLSNPADKLGFDMAAAARIGAVAHPKPNTLSPAAHAGHAITLGMQSYVPDRKAAMMQTIQAHPSAAAGAAAAVKQVAEHRDSFVEKVLKILHIH